MIGFHSPVPLSLVALCLLAGGVLLVRNARGLRTVTSGGTLWLLVGLRAASLLLVALILLNPFVVRKRPDAEQFRVAVAADVSGSMNTRDLADGRARIDGIRNALLSEDGLRNRLAARWTTESFLFGERSYPFGGSDFSTLPGKTALGTVLEESVSRGDRDALAAVVLLSDGNSNTGPFPQDSARRLGQLGIPVHTVGIGAERKPNDVAVSFREHALLAERGERKRLVAAVKSTFPESQTVDVLLMEGAELVSRRRVSVGGDQPEQSLEFHVQPFSRGNHVYRVAVDAPPNDRRPETDADYATVTVKKPDRFRILYLASHLSWQFPFLRRLSEEHEQMEMAAVVQTGQRAFARAGEMPEKAPEDAFPGTLDVFAEFDVMIVDSRVFSLYEEPEIEAVRAFVDRRGGGLLCIGPDESLPEAVRGVLPADGTQPGRVRARRYLDVEAPEILRAEGGSPLTVPPGPWLPEGARVFAMRDPKPAASTVLAVPVEGRQPISALAVQFYGSGRTAWLGAQTDWRWALATNEDNARHRSFWTALVAWLGSGTEPRLTVEGEGSKNPVGQPFALAAFVRDRQYRPAVAADVRYSVQNADGKTHQLEGIPSATEPGRFDALFTPQEAGEYRYSLRIRLPDGETLTRKGYFLAVPAGEELADVRFRPDVLRDIARLSGGSYFPDTESVKPSALALSPNLPTVEVRHELLDAAWALGLLLLCLTAEWYTRRRIGLL